VVEARPVQGRVHRLLRDDPKLSGVRELIEPLGYVGSKAIVDDCLREVRPVFFLPRRTPAFLVLVAIRSDRSISSKRRWRLDAS
jgi:hypothetical protein